MLDLIEEALNREGLSFCRIDGQSSLQQRRQALDTFGASDGKHRVMLASIGAAGEGIDLTAASVVHLVEPHWNPMAEAQAIDRIHGIGQTCDVEVIRYIVKDSMENYIQWVQNQKLKMFEDAMSSHSASAKADNERFKRSAV
ncbi:hypothetical protein Sste5344_004553 [Sporothrix stenoceras]